MEKHNAYSMQKKSRQRLSKYEVSATIKKSYPKSKVSYKT